MADASSDNNHLNRRSKFTYSVALCILNAAFGLMSEITASTLMDIAEQTSSSMEDVTFGIIVRTCAFALGSLFFGWAFERMNRQLGVTVVLLAMAVNTAVTPFESNLIMFQASMFVNGICGAAVDIASMTWMLEMWTASGTSSLLTLLLFYNLGAAIVPAVSAPFLSTENVRFNNNGTSIFLEKESMIVIPYLMSASFGLLIAASFLSLFFCKPYIQPQITTLKPSESVKDYDVEEGVICHRKYGSCESVINLLPNDYRTSKMETFRILVIMLAGLTFCSYSGMELVDLTMLPEYLMSLDLGISKSTATLMLSVTTASYAASRGIFILLSKIFNNSILLGMSITLLTISNLLLLTCSGTESMIWISIILMGAGFAPYQAAIVAFIEERVTLTSSLVGCLMFLSAVSSMADMLLISKLVQSHPQTFVWINMGSLSLCSLLLAGLHVNDAVRNYSCQKTDLVPI